MSTTKTSSSRPCKEGIASRIDRLTTHDTLVHEHNLQAGRCSHEAKDRAAQAVLPAQARQDMQIWVTPMQPQGPQAAPG